MAAARAAAATARPRDHTGSETTRPHRQQDHAATPAADSGAGQDGIYSNAGAISDWSGRKVRKARRENGPKSGPLEDAEGELVMATRVIPSVVEENPDRSRRTGGSRMCTSAGVLMANGSSVWRSCTGFAVSESRICSLTVGAKAAHVLKTTLSNLVVLM